LSSLGVRGSEGIEGKTIKKRHWGKKGRPLVRSRIVTNQCVRRKEKKLRIKFFLRKKRNPPLREKPYPYLKSPRRGEGRQTMSNLKEGKKREITKKGKGRKPWTAPGELY